jgi:hypothetical protein
MRRSQTSHTTLWPSPSLGAPPKRTPPEQRAARAEHADEPHRHCGDAGSGDELRRLRRLAVPQREGRGRIDEAENEQEPAERGGAGIVEDHVEEEQPCADAGQCGEQGLVGGADPERREGRQPGDAGEDQEAEAGRVRVHADQVPELPEGEPRKQHAGDHQHRVPAGHLAGGESTECAKPEDDDAGHRRYE